MKNLIFVCLLFFMASCSLFKRSTVDINKTHVEEKTTIKSRVDSSATKTDNTVIVKRVSVDTTVKTKGSKINTVKVIDLNKLIDGLTTVDSGLVQVHIQYDSLSKSLKTTVIVKPETIPFHYNKEKTTYVNTTENSKKTTDLNQEHAIIVDQKTKVKTKEPVKMGIVFAIAAFFILVIAAAIWWFFGRKAKAVKDLV